jgi:hypothetical protein
MFMRQKLISLPCVVCGYIDRTETASNATIQVVPDIQRMIFPIAELPVDERVNVASSDAYTVDPSSVTAVTPVTAS